MTHERGRNEHIICEQILDTQTMKTFKKGSDSLATITEWITGNKEQETMTATDIKTNDTKWREFAPSILCKGEDAKDKNAKYAVDENYRTIHGGGFSITGYIKPKDAKLMAAAPEMYEALEVIKKFIGQYNYGHPDLIIFIEHKGLFEIANEAIKKATE